MPVMGCTSAQPQRPHYADEAARDDKPSHELTRKRPQPLDSQNSLHELVSRSRMVWNRLSENPQNEALLTWENGEKVDRREESCSNCVSHFPADCIGLIQAQFSNKWTSSEAKGTCFLVSKDLALTSAHTFCHLHPETREVVIVPPRKIFLGLQGDVLVGSQASLNPSNFFKVKDFRLNEQFIQITRKIGQIECEISKSDKKMTQEELGKQVQKIHDLKVQGQEHDFALIRLQGSSPLKRFLKLQFCGSRINKEVKIQGYEVFKMSHNTRKLKQYFHSGLVSKESHHATYYDVDTKTQQSGSPVMATGSDGEAEVVALHKGYNPRINLNVGTKITPEVVNIVKKWAEGMGAAYSPNENRLKNEPKDLDVQAKAYINELIAEKEAIEETYMSEVSRVRHELKMKEKRLAEKEQRVKDLTQRLEEKEKELDSLEIKLKEGHLMLSKASKAQGRNVADTLKILEQQKMIEDLKVSQFRLKEELDQKIKQIDGLRGRMSPMRQTNKSSSAEFSLFRQNSLLEIASFDWDLKTPFAYAFKVEGYKAKLNLDGERYQLTNLDPLPPRSATNFVFHKYGGNTFMGVGIITADRKEERWSGDHEESVSLLSSPSTRNGIVRINGEKKSEFTENFFVPEGGEISMEVDLKKLSIGFRNYGVGIKWTFVLPEVFAEKKVFAYVVMGSAEDCIEVVR